MKLVFNNISLKLNNRDDINDKPFLEIEKLELNKGDSLFILGKNGSGKSTLLKTFFSPIKSDKYANIDYSNNPSLHIFSDYNFLSYEGQNDSTQIFKHYVYISQEENFVRNASVWQVLIEPSLVGLGAEFDYNVSYFDINELAYYYCKNYLMEIYIHDNDKKIKKPVNDLEEEDIIKYFKKKKVNQCSGGEKKLISLIQGFIKAELFNIPLIVLDEPLNFLDPSNLDKVVEILSQLKDKYGFTYLIISHLLIFDFINDDSTVQYYISDERKLKKIKKKIIHDISSNYEEVF